MRTLGEDAMEQRLRWMMENLNGAYTARHPKGHPKTGSVGHETLLRSGSPKVRRRRICTTGEGAGLVDFLDSRFDALAELREASRRTRDSPCSRQR